MSNTKTTTTRTHAVQTPGAAATPKAEEQVNPKITPPDAPIDQSESKDKDVLAAVDQSLTDGTLGGDRAVTGNVGNSDLVSNQNQPTPEPAATPKAGKVRLNAEDYKRMRSADVDPDVITAPVLTADGWVVPTPKEAKK